MKQVGTGTQPKFITELKALLKTHNVNIKRSGFHRDGKDIVFYGGTNRPNGTWGINFKATELDKLGEGE